MPNYKQIYAIKAKNEKTIKEMCPAAAHKPGIYCFYRIGEEGIKHAYIGQATKSVLSRMAEHLSTYQYIDVSLRKWGWHSDENPYGYNAAVLCFCEPSACDELEQQYILQWANEGYQLKNRTSGSQSKGKTDIAEKRPSRNYYDGVEVGKMKARRFVADLFSKHLDVSMKKPTKNAEKAYKKFMEFINLEEEKP